ncbi:unnamed protein product [Phytophthora fragariaefolia]|uniref:Unnamed protein product n=1 Tax=Phytophthora fragariaefolia TaxID=1490495 RepID=A0A9W6XU40_9STRA|nr:unnamed protein product [Phytophthora fragariaefolia]
MATTSGSAAEASARAETPPSADLTGLQTARDATADAHRAARVPTAPETQELRETAENRNVAILGSLGSHVTNGGGTRASRPRAAAAAANAEMTKQVQQEEMPLSVVLARAPSPAAVAPADVADTTPEAMLIVDDVAMIAQEQAAEEQSSKRPSRAAAAAATAGMARQVKEEEGSFGLLLASALVRPSEQDQELEASAKKRTSEMATPAPKRSRVATTPSSRKAAQNSLELASEEKQPARGKKRRQAPVFEAAPIITDLPPLPFTSLSPELKLKNKIKSKNRHTASSKFKVKVSTAEAEENDVRSCEFCRKTANLCVLMHCHSCRRVYHAQCFWSAFKPYVDANVPISEQIERVQLDAERRGNIFRCASCKAAFMDFCESGGYLWDCDCPTCAQPEKVVYYRQRKLVEMMNDMELEKQRKKDQKDQAAKVRKSGTPKLPTATPSRSNSMSRSRRTRGSSAALDDQLLDARTTPSRSQAVPPEDHNLKKGNNVVHAYPTDVVDDGNKVKNDARSTHGDTKAEPMGVVNSADVRLASEESTNPEADSKSQTSTIVEEQASNTPPSYETRSDSERQHLVNVDALKTECAKPQMSQDLVSPPNQEKQSPKIKYEPVGEPEQPNLSGDDLVSAVRVEREGKSDRWCFPVMCSRTASLRVSGVMKTGTCKWSLKRAAVIQCECCSKLFSYPEFVHHTDSSLVKDTKCAGEDPFPFLFVEHRDTTQHTPLEDFHPALRSWVARQSANNTPTKSRRGHAMRQETIAVVTSSTMSMTNPEAPGDVLPGLIPRLRALALFKRPKHRSDNTSSLTARLPDPASLEFLAQVVCLSSKYVMNMSNGSLADRVVRSKTPVPDGSFPRKSGWLAFSRMGTPARQVTCTCCEKGFNFDEFVDHAGIPLSEMKNKPRQLLYVVERMDESALRPYISFAMDLDKAAKGSGLDLLLSELHPPPPSPRPI